MGHRRTRGDLGVGPLRLLTNNPAKREGLEAYGLTMLERVPLHTEPTTENVRHLAAKQRRMGHLLDLQRTAGSPTATPHGRLHRPANDARWPRRRRSAPAASSGAQVIAATTTPSERSSPSSNRGLQQRLSGDLREVLLATEGPTTIA